MNRSILFRQLRAVAVCGLVLAGHGVLAQQPQPERLHFVLTTLLAGPRGQSTPTDDQPVEVRTADYNSSYTRRTLLPAMRRSVAAGDIDGDGVPYLYVAGSGRSRLLMQSPSGKLRDITGAARVPGLEESLSATFSDYDRSGQQSLFLAGPEGITLYRANRGTPSFADVTRKAGLLSTPGVLCTSAVLGDLDGDGFPDLFVAAYTNLTQPSSEPVFTFPNDFRGVTSRLYRNNGNGTFTDVTESSGIGKNPGRARKAILADLNNDQRLDILVLRDDKPPVLYLNRGGWTFEDKTWDAGNDLTTHAFFEGAVTDFNRDGKADLALWSTHSFRVLINQGNARFERSASTSMPEPSISLFGFRGVIADLDDNGFDDVMTVDRNGRLHAYTNHSGAFREASFELPEGFEGSYLAPIRMKGSQGLHLLGIQPDGRIAVLGRLGQ